MTGMPSQSKGESDHEALIASRIQQWQETTLDKIADEAIVATPDTVIKGCNVHEIVHGIYLGADFAKANAPHLNQLLVSDDASEEIPFLLDQYKADPVKGGELCKFDELPNDLLASIMEEVLVALPKEVEKQLIEILEQYATKGSVVWESTKFSTIGGYCSSNIGAAVIKALEDRYVFRPERMDEDSNEDCQDEKKEDEGEQAHGARRRSSIRVSWKEVAFGKASLEDGLVHVGLSCHKKSPLLRHANASRELMEYLASMDKKVCIVIADTLNRYNVEAFETRYKNCSRKKAKKQGDIFFAKVLEAKAAVESSRNEKLDRITILRWDDIETKEFNTKVEACIDFYENNAFFKDLLLPICRDVVMTRRKQAPQEKIDLVVKYVLTELPHLLGGVHLAEEDGSVTHYSQFLYPNIWHEICPNSVSQRLYGLFTGMHVDERFAPMIDDIRRLGKGSMGAPGHHVLPLGLKY